MARTQARLTAAPKNVHLPLVENGLGMGMDGVAREVDNCGQIETTENCSSSTVEFASIGWVCFFISPTTSHNLPRKVSFKGKGMVRGVGYRQTRPLMWSKGRGKIKTAHVDGGRIWLHL